MSYPLKGINAITDCEVLYKFLDNKKKALAFRQVVIQKRADGCDEQGEKIASVLKVEKANLASLRQVMKQLTEEEQANLQKRKVRLELGIMILEEKKVSAGYTGLSENQFELRLIQLQLEEVERMLADINERQAEIPVASVVDITASKDSADSSQGG